MLIAGIDVNIKDDAGWIVVLSGSISIVRRPFEAGADLKAETKWGDSALSLTATVGQ